MTTVTERRPLPWSVCPPYNGCNEKRMQYSVLDDDGNMICECDGDDEGRDEAIEIVRAVNAAGPKVCFQCGEPATWFGPYDDELTPVYACNDCVGDGEGTGEEVR